MQLDGPETLPNTLFDSRPQKRGFFSQLPRWTARLILVGLFLHFFTLIRPPTAPLPPATPPLDILTNIPSSLSDLRVGMTFWEERFHAKKRMDLLKEKDLFPLPDALSPQADFWKKVFTQYTQRQVVIHDDWYLNVIYGVVDLDEADEESGLSGWDAVNAAKKDVGTRLAGMIEKWDRPKTMNRDQRRLYKMFKDLPESPRFPLKDAPKRVHGQLGQADSFRQGIAFSGRYIGAIQEIFAEKDLPISLACLPLIESAFNPYSLSYVGAAGMWQFMLATGKQFGLKIDWHVDERRDPLLAARAAARLLAHNYKTLGSWPLAITAYNYGLQGMMNAVRDVGSDRIEEIVARFDGSRFDFASRNFYVEFIVGVEVYKDRERYYEGIVLDDPLEIIQVRIPNPIGVETLEKYCGLEVEILRSLNPALHKTAFSKEGLIPGGYRLNILAHAEPDFLAGYAKIPAAEKAVKVAADRKHRVRSRQTLSHIAELYGTSVRNLARFNGLTNPRRLRAGQMIKIPGTRIGKDSASKDSKGSGFIRHRVRKGQTLIKIAKLYNTSPKVIAEYNSIKNPRKILAGQLLKIPEG